MTSRRAGNVLQQSTESHHPSATFLNGLPEHFGRRKIVAQKCHHAVIAHDNIAPGTTTLVTIIVPRCQTRTQRRHEDFVQTFLVNGNLYRHIQPLRGIGFGFGNDTAVFGIGQKSFFWNEAFEYHGRDKVRIPEETKKRQECQNHFHNNPTDTGVEPKGDNQ